MATKASRIDLRSRPKPYLAVVAGSGAALPSTALGEAAKTLITKH